MEREGRQGSWPGGTDCSLLIKGHFLQNRVCRTGTPRSWQIGSRIELELW
jgi:hypothetical protein